MDTQYELSTLNWLDLVRRMAWDLSLEGALDNETSKRFESITQLSELWYYAYKLKEYPNTVSKLNEVILKHLNSSEADRHLGNLVSFSEYLTPEVKDRLLEMFIGGRFNPGWRIKDFLYPNSKYCPTLIETFIDKYKRGCYWHSCIKEAFECLRNEDLDAGCALLAKATPNIRVLLLARKDIKEEFVLVGLRALGKLKNPQSVSATVSVDMLRKLSPKSRLTAIKHLIGYGKSWRRRNMYLRKPPVEFDKTPTKEELSELLFSCSIELNDQVAAVVGYYDTYLARLKQEE